MKTVVKVVALTSLVWSVACGGPEGAVASGQLQAATKQVHTLGRGARSKVSLLTLPNAACELRADGVATKMTLNSDDRGVVHFHAAPIAEADRAVELTLTCTDADGNQKAHAIELNLGDVESTEGRELEALPHPGQFVRPALGTEADTLANDDLVSRGYPPRPDRERAPGAFARWQREVTTDFTVVPPVLVNTGKMHPGPQNFVVQSNGGAENGTGTSNNWSGVVMTGSGTVYAAVYGWWPVPKGNAEGTFWHTDASSFWVGLEGWSGGNNTDLIQDGSASDTGTYFWIETSSYAAWAETWPYNSQQNASNFDINPGDELGAYSWFGNYAKYLDLRGDRGWFEMTNYSTNTTTGPYAIVLPSNHTPYIGDTAEWIFERTTIGGSLPSLTDYGSAAMHDAISWDFNANSHVITYGGNGGDQYTNVTMMNGNNVLSTCSVQDATDFDYTFHNRS